MKSPFKNLKVWLMTCLLIITVAAGASADMGRGSAYRSQMHYGGYGASGWGAFNNLSEEDIKRLDEERKTFFKDTKDLRREVYQKRLELSSEMAKQKPDAVRAAAIQKEISETRAQLAQKHLDHLFRVREINPDLGMGFGGGGPVGFGMMHSEMMGGGGSGYRGNPDCPYGGPGGGYGRGRHMMGPMGWDRDESRQYHKGPGALAE